jgi:hypothetical protein
MPMIEHPTAQGERMRPITDHQPELPFEFGALNEATLRAAHAHSHLEIPFERAVRDRALAICLRCLVQARLRQRARRG